MIVQFWGTRGSIATPGPATMRYGGDTSCVEVRAGDGDPEHIVVLDAGTGIRRFGGSIDAATRRVDIMLSHLHMDHIQGLGFCGALFRPGLEVHLWGPSTVRQSLRQRLQRYLSPPLFPVRLHELPCDLHLHDVANASFDVPGIHVDCEFVCHPGLTVGYRLTDRASTLTYLSDHDPALGHQVFPPDPTWTSGFRLARDADLLIHDAQFTRDQYLTRAGWGHATLDHACEFALHVGARRLAAFHHDPLNDDDTIDELLVAAIDRYAPDLDVFGARDDLVVSV
ncbi:MAG: MBL fold metallo-hydrolase [Ilumatobacter sp.]|nr:MBL fold metallo-hydrolase [Ilumatobacter sp.]